MPGLRKRPELTATMQQLVLKVLGVGAISAADFALH